MIIYDLKKSNIFAKIVEKTFDLQNGEFFVNK